MNRVYVDGEERDTADSVAAANVSGHTLDGRVTSPLLLFSEQQNLKELS
jgi:hypothetical protein